MATRAYWSAVITKSDDTTLTASMAMMPRFSFTKSVTNQTGNGTFTLINPGSLYSGDFIEGKDFKFYYGHDTIPYMFGGYISKIKKSGEELEFVVSPYMSLLKRAKIRSESFGNKAGSYCVAETTYGIIQKYYEDDAVQTNIYTGNHVDKYALDYIYEDDGGAFSANRNATAAFDYFDNAVAVNDALYFGRSTSQWDGLTFYVGTAANVGVWNVTWEYWNGSAWSGLTSVVDGTNEFVNTGSRTVYWTAPTNWATTTVNSQSAYWVRVRASTVTAPVEGGANSTYAVTTQELINAELDNMDALEAMQEIARVTRRSGRLIPYDFWVDYCTTHSQVEMWFYPKNYSDSGVTLYEGYDFSRDIIVEKGSLDNLYNWVKVFGWDKLPVFTPNDTYHDYWTEPADDAAAQAYWTAVNGAVNSSGLQSDFDTQSVRFNGDAGPNDGELILNLDDTDAYDSTNTANNFTSGSGYAKVRDGDGQYLEFHLAGDTADKFRLQIAFDGVYKEAVSGMTTADAFFTRHRIKLNDVYAGDWSFVDKIKFIFVDQDNYDEYVNLLYFISYEELVSNPDAGTPHAKDNTSITAYGKREYLYYDRTLKNQTLVDDMADKLLVKLKDPPEKYVITLNKAINTPTLGDTFTLEAPIHGITSQNARVSEIFVSHNEMTITALKNTLYTEPTTPGSEAITNTTRGIRESQRR